jgi:hypothetical protein
MDGLGNRTSLLVARRRVGNYRGYWLGMGLPGGVDDVLLASPQTPCGEIEGRKSEK